MRESSWQDDGFRVGHPNRADLDVLLTSQEFNLLLTVRSLRAGSYTIQIVKTDRGRDGFHSFRVTENASERSGG